MGQGSAAPAVVDGRVVNRRTKNRRQELKTGNWLRALLAQPQIRRADAQAAGNVLIERMEDRQRSERVRERQRQDVRVTVVEPAPQQRGAESDGSEERVGQVHDAEQQRGEEDAGQPRRRALALAQDDGL